MTDQAKPHPALKVRCPQCGAQANFKCQRVRSQKDVRLVFLKNPHAARVQAAKTVGGS